MFGARALLLKGVEKWTYQPRLLNISRPFILATRKSSTLSLATTSQPTPSQSPDSQSDPSQSPDSQSTQLTQVGDTTARQGHRSRLRITRQSIGPRKSFTLRTRRSSYESERLWALSDFLWHNECNRLHELSSEGHPLGAVARDGSSQLSSLLASEILRQLVGRGEIDPAWASDLESADEFRARVTSWTSQRNFASDVVSHWADIALTRHSDTRARKFGLSTRPKPWLLFCSCLLHERYRYANNESLLYLVEHVMNWQVRFSQQAGHISTPFTMESKRFATAVTLLVEKCLHTCPELLPNLARATADFIKSIPLVASRSRGTHGYQCQCHVFNKVIEALGKEPAQGRQAARELCWEAQKILLECSSTSRRQMIISRQSYRSLRRVMLSLKKTASEIKVALRSSTSWPPYRKVWDGTDELRKPEDDLSRASKAGILMHEAGYSSDWDDEALTVLGGSFPGRPPTVQTRTLDFDFSNTPETLWIAQVTATRNAREAWGVFQSPPVPGMLPTTGVYAAMFSKLYALPVDMPGIVPGDTARVFPVDNGNLSPFAIASLEPPDPRSLYQRMLKQRLAPTGLCLKLLIRNADDMEEVMQYFKKSPYSSAAPVLEMALDAIPEIELDDLSHPDLYPMREMLSFIPPDILAAWLSAFCRIRPDYQTGACHITNAVFLARLYKSCMPPGSLDSAPLFREIATALGRGKMVRVTEEYIPDISHRAALTLRVFLVLYSEFSSVWKGADERMFQAFCLVLHKTVRAFVFRSKAGAKAVILRDRQMALELFQSQHLLLEHCGNGILQEFKLLIQPVDEEKAASFSIEFHQPRSPLLRVAVTLLVYMRALAATGNVDEMVRGVDWLFDSYEKGLVFSRDLITPGAPEYQALISTLAYCDTILEKLGASSPQTRLRDRLQFLRDERACTWFFRELEPSSQLHVDEDVLCAKVYKALAAKCTSSR